MFCELVSWRPVLPYYPLHIAWLTVTAWYVDFKRENTRIFSLTRKWDLYKDYGCPIMVCPCSLLHFLSNIRGTFTWKPCFAMWLFIKMADLKESIQESRQAQEEESELWLYMTKMLKYHSAFHEELSVRLLSWVTLLTFATWILTDCCHCKMLFATAGRFCLGGRAVGKLQVLECTEYALTVFFVMIFAFHLPPKSQKAKTKLSAL